MRRIQIAVDGPSGAGKSTLARRLAARLGCVYVDTGAMYRAIAYTMIQHHAETETQITEHLKELVISIQYVDGEQHVFANGEDVSGMIRTPEVSMRASTVSALPVVRAFLLEQQRQLAETQDVVMDGRDIGTVVLPNATIKIFLTASPEKRAYRRYLELEAKQSGMQSYEDVLADVIRRDEQDMTREIAPLRQADDAIVVDTSEADLEQSEQMLLDVCKEKLGL